jgi:hypothetical protein
MPNIQFQFRRGTASQWSTANPILAQGEMGIETDTNKFKIGNGSTDWNNLNYGGIQGIQGIQGISGSSTLINATDTTDAGTYYPVFVASAGSDQTARVKSSATAFSFNPGTGEVAATDFNSLSDHSLKKDIADIEDPLGVISQLNPVSFSWKDIDKKSFGFIAQEVEKILPEIVTETQGIKALSYSQIIPFLVSAINKLNSQIQCMKHSSKEIDDNIDHPTTTFDPVSQTLSTTAVSDSKLYYNPGTGTLNAFGFNNLSDATLKKDFVEIRDPLSIINKINPVYFCWKDTDRHAYGVIAQEIEKILPELVETTNLNQKSVAYIQLIPIIIQAVKDQQKYIDKLTKEIIQLNNNIRGEK